MSIAKKAATALGVVFIAIGILGFTNPALGGTHLSPLHNLIHIVSGMTALYFGRMCVSEQTRIFCIIFGLAYFLLGVAGFALGTPTIVMSMVVDSPTVLLRADLAVLRLIPDILELGARDHLLHVLLGGVFVVAGLATPMRAVPLSNIAVATTSMTRAGTSTENAGE